MYIDGTSITTRGTYVLILVSYIDTEIVKLREIKNKHYMNIFQQLEIKSRSIMTDTVELAIKNMLHENKIYGDKVST